MTKKQILDYLQYAPYDVLFKEAQNVRREYCGKSVFVRGIVDFSNTCVRNCLYCGLRRDNTALGRYRMSIEEIVFAVGTVAQQGIKSVILQSGDDFSYTRQMICLLIQKIKKQYPSMAITLSIGERPDEEYRAFYDAGADRYLLKVETTNKELYERLHPAQTLTERMRIVDALRAIGYQIGTGTIIGLPFQRLSDIAEDIVFLKNVSADMIGAGPFIPQSNTTLKEYSPAGMALVLKVLALLRVITKNSLLPATTALATIDPIKGQSLGLKAGCNVIMCDFTPPGYRKQYQIYDRKAAVTVTRALHAIAQERLTVSFERGDSFKMSPVSAKPPR